MQLPVGSVRSADAWKKENEQDQSRAVGSGFFSAAMRSQREASRSESPGAPAQRPAAPALNAVARLLTHQ